MCVHSAVCGAAVVFFAVRMIDFAFFFQFGDFCLTLAIVALTAPPMFWLRKMWKTGTLPRARFAGMLSLFCVAAGAAGFLLLSIEMSRSQHERCCFVTDSNNAKQLALGILNYEARNGHFPPAYTVDESGKALHSWRVLVLPYLESGQLYDKIRLDEPWDSPWNAQFHDQMPSVFQTYQHKEKSTTLFQVVLGERTVFPPDGKFVIRDEIDGSEVLVVTGEPVCWMDPAGNVPYEKAVQNQGLRQDYFRPVFVCADGSGSYNEKTYDVKYLLQHFTRKELPAEQK